MMGHILCAREYQAKCHGKPKQESELLEEQLEDAIGIHRRKRPLGPPWAPSTYQSCNMGYRASRGHAADISCSH